MCAAIFTFARYFLIAIRFAHFGHFPHAHVIFGPPPNVVRAAARRRPISLYSVSADSADTSAIFFFAITKKVYHNCVLLLRYNCT